MDRRRAGALLALAACIACSATAPTASNHTALDLYDGAPEGCYYNFQHYGEGDRIMTNEPCLNCTCHNRMLMCYLRVCPFTKPIGQDCTIEKRADQCCPIVTCPDVPVDLLTSTSTTSPAEYGETGLEKLTKYGCSISGKYFPEGSKVPQTPNKPCEHCYCIRNMTTCVMQECTLHVDGCTPIYHKDVCCPVRYSCDHPEDEMPLLDDMSTTVRPTPGFLLTTTTISPVTQMTQDCVHDDQVFADGALIKTEKACEHCYCMKGDIVCVVQECGTPMENEGKNCTSLPPREGQCCPDTYICEGDELGTELPTDLTTESVLDSPTTLLPPRRTVVEGSGYRNEPDEIPFTDIPAIQPEHEGSGEEQATLSPFDTTEKLDAEKPVETDDLVAATEEGLYTSHTTITPPFEEPEDTTANEIPGAIETQEYIPASTNVPVEKGDEIDTTEENLIQDGVTEKEDLTPLERISTTLAPEMYDKITTEPGEALNTVPDSIPKEEDIESHKNIPSSTIASVEETERTTPSVTEEEIATSGLSEKKTTKPGYSYPSPTISADKTSDTTKEHGDIPYDSTTQKESSEAEKYVPSTPSTSMIVEIETKTPEIHESVDISKENDRTEPNVYISSTISNPTEKSDETTNEPDHGENTVAVVEEDNIQPHVYTTTTRTSLEVAAGTTLPSMELDSGTEDITEENILELFEHTATASPVKEESMKTTAEPDKGLNTIPGEIIEESSSEASLSEKTTVSHETSATDSDDTRRTESKPTIASEYSTLPSESTVSKADYFTVTTEPSFRKEDENGISTEKSKESETTTGKLDFTDEGFIPTSSHDEKLDTGAVVPATEQEFTTSVPDNEVEAKLSTTESVLESSVSSATLPEKVPELPSEQGTEFIFETPTTEKISEITLAAGIEAHEEPGRIPGEGDCLLNGITYRNNSVVPNTNNCHSGCKCVSSIIKCDPIICSPPPDYMDNCQSIYDSPDSCCPTYVCDHPRETVPPQSDNQMSGTESPQPSPTIECRGDQCEINTGTKYPTESSDKPVSHECGPEGCEGIAQKHDDSKYPLEYPDGCKDGKCPSHADDCANGKCKVPPTHELLCDPEHGCQAVPIKPCEGKQCKETSEEAVKPPQLCENKEDCKDMTNCEGDSCKFEVSSPQDTQQVPCKDEDGCKSEHVIPQECTGDSCIKNEIPEVGHNLPSECEGSQCVQQTEIEPEEGTQPVISESTVQKQTPSESITEKLETIENEHQTTGSQKESDDASTQHPHIPKQDMSTVIPEIMTVSHEIISESESPVNELETITPEERRTTLSESYVTESDKSSQPTEKAIGPVTESYTDELPESHTFKPKLTTATPDKDSSEATDKLPEVYVTQSQQITTESTATFEIDRKTPGSDQQTTISENIDHAKTTVPYGTETAEIITPAYDKDQSEVTKLNDISSETPTHGQEIGTQTTQSSAIQESSTGVPFSENEPVSSITDVKEESETIEVETDTPTHDLRIPETSVTIPEDIVSKSTESTTEEEYGFTDSPGYERPGTKPENIEPIQIEPLEVTTESQKSPTVAEESTIRASGIPEYTTEKEQVEMELPVDLPHVTEFSDKKQTESPEKYGTESEQPISKPPVDISSSEETDTDASPVIKEHVTEILSPSTTEPETSFTEIEDAFVTGEGQTTTEKSIADVTISVHADKSTELAESPTTEKLHEIVEMSLPTSGKPLYPDSLSVGVTEPQEISTKATEQIVTDKQKEEERETEKDISKIDVGVKSEPSSEVPPAQESSEVELPDKMPQPEKPEAEEKDESTEKDVHKTSVHLTTESQEFITKQPQLDGETTESVFITSQGGEKTTYVPETEDIQVHVSTKAPEMFVTEQETVTELPPKEYSKIPATTEISSTPVIKEVVSIEELEDIHTELPVSQITTKSPESVVSDQEEYIGTTSSAPVTTKDKTIEPGFTQISETTKSEEVVQTELPIQHVPELFETITKTPEGTTQSDTEITEQTEHVTNTPVDEEEPEPGRTGSIEAITKAPEDVQESQPEVTGQDEVSKTPEDTKQSEIETTEYEEKTTKSPEDKVSTPETIQIDKTTTAPDYIKETQTDVTIQKEKAPEVTEVSEIEVTRPKEDSTKAPEIIKELEPQVTEQEEAEVTKSPEDVHVLEPEVTEQKKEPIPVVSQQEEVTKLPEVAIYTESHVTSQVEEVTKSTTDKQQAEVDVTGIDEEETKVPGDMEVSLPETSGQDEKVTKAPEGMKESLPEITRREEEVTKAPEEMKESLPEITILEEEVTKAPEDTKESLPEITDQEEGGTKAPEETKASEPAISQKEEVVTKAPEDMKESLPEITEQEEEITKAPDGTKELVPEISGEEAEVTKAPEDKKETIPKITGQEEEVTQAPEDTKESELELPKKEEEVNKVPEVTKESLPHITDQEEEVTKAPEYTKESVTEITGEEAEVTEALEDKKETLPEITGQEEEVTKAPEDTKEILPEITGHEGEVTKAPEDTKESVTDITGEEAEVTKAPEDKKETLPEITGKEEEVTKASEDTKESVTEITGEEVKVTKAPEDKKETLPEITGQEEEVTKAPEDTKESVTDITGEEVKVTKAPEDKKEALPEITGQEEEVTKGPEDTKESVTDITGEVAEVTKASEDKKETLPEITGQEEEVTKGPEDTKESVPEITGEEAEVTKAPEDKKETLPEITGQEEEVTKAPEDTKESVPEITGEEAEVTKAPEDKKETLPEITGQEEEVTKAPEDTKESVTEAPEDQKETLPEITGYKEEETKTPEDTKELVTEITGEEVEVTKAPEDKKESLPEISGQEQEVSKTPEDTKESLPEVTGLEKEVTKAPVDFKKPMAEITEQELEVTKAPERTKEGLPEITGQEQEVTKAPEGITGSLPEITGQEGEVTKAPEGITESLPEITGQEGEVTKAPEDSKESLPEITRQEQEVTKSPEDIKQSAPEIIDQGEKVIKVPEDTKESLPEIITQEEEVTKVPEDTKESLPEITKQEEEVTKAPEDTKESAPAITGQEEEVTKAPEDMKDQDSQPVVPSEEEKVTKTPEDDNELGSVTEKQETTPTLLEIHVPHEVITESTEIDSKIPEDTTLKQVEELATEQPKDQYSETTPDVIILEEHTHKMMEESSTASSSHGEQTTVYVDSEAPVSEVNSQKPTEEHTETEEVEKTTKADEGLFTAPTLPPTTLSSLDQVTEKVSESSLPTAVTAADHKVDEIIKENEPTSAPALEETTHTAHIDSEKSPTPDTEVPMHTEKIPSPTEKPVHHEIIHETTVAEDELLITTPKTTTVKQEEVTETKPEKKPVDSSEATPSATIPESPKPSETQPTDELPTPEEDSHFPPSSGYADTEDYGEEDQAISPGTCRYGGKVYVSAQQIPRDDPCDFCFCFRSDIICLQQSCPPPIHGCHEEPIQGFCCPRYECPVSMATTINMTTTTTTTTTTLPPHFPTHSYKGAAQRRGCQIKGHTYKVGEVVRSSSGPCLHCTCGGDGQMKCDPKACTPEPMLRQMIAAAVSAKRRR